MAPVSLEAAIARRRSIEEQTPIKRKAPPVTKEQNDLGYGVDIGITSTPQNTARPSLQDAAKNFERYQGLIGFFRRKFTDKKGYETAQKSLQDSMSSALGKETQASLLKIAQPENPKNPQIAELSSSLQQGQTLYIHKATGYARVLSQTTTITNPNEWMTVRKGPKQSFFVGSPGQKETKYAFGVDGLGQIMNVQESE